MDTYSFLRELADSWVLLAMVIFYLAAIAWAFRPGSRKVHADISEIPFRNEHLPAEGADEGANRAAHYSPEAR